MRALLGEIESSTQEISKIMLKALHFAYGVDETYAFENGPKLDAVATLIHRLERM